jgi:hypothetical protein
VIDTENVYVAVEPAGFAVAGVVHDPPVPPLPCAFALTEKIGAATFGVE